MDPRQYGKQFFCVQVKRKVLALPFQLGKVEEKVVHTSTLPLLRPFTMSLSEEEIPTHLSSRVLHVMLEIP